MEPDKNSSEEFSEYHVEWIKDRIDSEFKKHSRSEGLDWSLIAAKKIVATFKEKYTLLNKNES